MRILVIGAGGFIGAQVAAAIHGSGRRVVAAIRTVAAVERRLPFAEAVPVDLAASLNPGDWAPHLEGIDAVVNCAGLLQADEATLEAVHHLAPAALFTACAKAGIRKVIHLSAVSADPDAGTAYAATKWRGEEALRRSDLDWILLRPSLVWSARGSYGGTSALRGLAGLPFLVPLIGAGQQVFTPITVEDLARTVVQLLAPDAPSRLTLEPCGPETLTTREILVKLRRWLGLAPARFVPTPMPLIRLVCRLGDVLGRGPVTTTSLRQIEYGNAADGAAFAAEIGFQPESMDQALAKQPAQEQDLWHARLTFLEPLLRLVLVLLWFGSGIAGLLAPPSEIIELLAATSLSEGASVALGRAASILDLLIAVAVALAWRPQLLGWVQLCLVASYTTLLTVTAPALWLAPLGPLLKNLPILAAIAVHMVLARKR